MNTSNRMKQLAVFGLATATASLALTAMAAPAAPAAPRMIRVLSVAGADAASPEADVWKKTPATQEIGRAHV